MGDPEGVASEKPRRTERRWWKAIKDREIQGTHITRVSSPDDRKGMGRREEDMTARLQLNSAWTIKGQNSPIVEHHFREDCS